jgi:hypothetical protein
MKPSCLRSRFVVFAIACVVALQISPGLAAGHPAAARDKDDERRGVQVVFTKWVTDWPNMAGLVSGDVGGGTFAGEVLNYTPTAAIDKIEALYHLNGGAHQLNAHVFVTQNNLNGTAVFKGVVITEGRLKGARVRGDYQVISPCGVTNAQLGTAGDVCFQGTLDIGRISED